MDIVERLAGIYSEHISLLDSFVGEIARRAAAPRHAQAKS